MAIPTRYRHGYLVLAITSLLVACGEPQELPPEVTEEVPPIPMGLGVDLDNMDRSVRPQDDFFRFVNGGWLDRTEIPDDRSRWGSFDELVEQSEEQVLAIITEIADTPGHVPGSDEQKVADLFLSFMGEAIIEANGLTPLADDFAAIDALSGHDALPEFWASQVMRRLSAPVSFGVGQDPGQSDRYLTSVGQAGLGLPDRDYYVSDNPRFVEFRDAYQQHIQNMFELAALDSVPDAAAAAERILALETRIAEAHWTRVQNRDRNATYNLMARTDLEGLAPGFDWLRFLDTAGLDQAEELNVRQPDYLEAVAAMYTELPLSHWQDYHRYHLLRANAPYLPEAFVEENFDFFARTLRGQPQIRARERRGVQLVQSNLGFMVGQFYVERHYPEAAAERMDDMVANIKQAFAESLQTLDWMGEETRREALAKLETLNTKIGHPEVWRDYSCVAIAADDLIGNIERATACEWGRLRNRLGSEVDRDEWFMTPQTVNAYYSAANNEIVFPAAILQPPFFNVAADDAVNYGAIGGVIGHEITHAFDDQGRRSDGEGNLRDWWTADDEERFSALAQRLVEQYSSYEPVEGAFIQGELSLGENIADLGGLSVAYRAYRMSLGDEPAPVIEGFTGDQRFFMGWGQVWRTKMREEALRQQLVTGPHAPGEFRAKGVLVNMSEFYEAFDVTEGDGMYLPEAERVRIW